MFSLSTTMQVSAAAAPTTEVLSRDSVERVLEDVRPFLVADGGDVRVVGVEEGVVSLELEGACAGCPSSGATMAMGVEHCLRAAFGQAIASIRLVRG